jgi:hypothetical protein
VSLQSDVGDYIGQGRYFSYTQANSVIAIWASAGHLFVRIAGDQRWFGEFEAPGSTALQRGAFTNLQRFLPENAGAGGLDWSGEGRGCHTLTGSFTINSVKYVGEDLSAIDLRFVQNCLSRTSALRGALHWRFDDRARPPGPVNPIPAALWRPSASSLPTTGNYVYLESSPGDFIGGGQTYRYTSVNDTIVLAPDSGRLGVTVNNPRGWGGTFSTMFTVSRFEPGYYGDLRRYPFHNPAKGGLVWFGERGCSSVVGCSPSIGARTVVGT